MPTPGWKRNWGTMHAVEEPPGALIRAAVRGDPIEHLLELGARTLLTTCAADRAGIWLIEIRRGQTSRGQVVEAMPGPMPGQWKHLDISTPFLREALESSNPLHVEFGSGQTVAQVGPLVGMHSATWIPIRSRKITLGLAMVAYARPGVEVDPALLEARADEIALSMAHDRDTRQRELAGEELHSQLRLSRAILAGVSAGSILAQISRAARHFLRAEFIALGRPSEPAMIGDGWDGPAEWRGLLQQQPLMQAWRKVLDEGREVEISGDAVKMSTTLASGHRSPALDRVIALPIVVRSKISGVLMAGLLKTENCDDDAERLESYALMAARALDLEVARGERAAATLSWQKYIQDSQEWLATIDEKGIIRETSSGAHSLLFAYSIATNDVRLEDLFSPVACDAVAQWREQFASAAGDIATQSRMVPLEAALNDGLVVCIRVRSVVEGLGFEGRRWLIHFEDRGSRRAQLNTAGRLEAEMAGLMDSIDSGVLLLDEEGNIRVVSDRLAAILGLEGRRLFELGNIEGLVDTLTCRFSRPAETAARWREHIRKREEASWDEFELVRPARKVVERFARPLFNADGTRLGWLEVYRDITGQRLIQSKLLQTEKMAALGQLMSGIAHELNNPLTSIQGYAQLLLSRHSTLHGTSDARRISQEAERASHIVKNLLLFSREAKSERRAVNLNEVIERTVALRAYEMKLESILVELVLDPGLPHTLADGAQLQQVILNLIVNAEQAILLKGPREGEPGDWQGRIVIHTRRIAGDRIGLEISDDGPGIAPEIVSRIFDPFFTTKPVGAGTGLGLSIVYGIVQEHGGEVGVESQPGHGATFTVELPALSAAAFDFTAEDPGGVPNASALMPVPLPGRIGLRPEFILVVEDEPTVAQLIADVLTEEGHRVDMLLDSREALQRLEEKNYDLVICDLKMPFLDGAGLYRALVRAASPCVRRLLFVTGDTMSPRTLEFLRSSGVPYLAKPFLVEELKVAVHRALAAAATDDEIALAPERLRVVRE